MKIARVSSGIVMDLLVYSLRIKSVNMRDSVVASCNCSGGLCKLGLTNLHDFDDL